MMKRIILTLITVMVAFSVLGAAVAYVWNSDLVPSVSWAHPISLKNALGLLGLVCFMLLWPMAVLLAALRWGIDGVKISGEIKGQQ